MRPASSCGKRRNRKYAIATASRSSHSARPMKRFLQGAFLVTLGLLVGLGLAEIAVRILAPHSRDRVTPPGLFAIDSTLGWKLHPEYRRRHNTRYFDAEYAINSLGFRDPQRTLAKPDSVKRLLLFGDSHVFGWGIPLGQRFSDIVESSTGNLEVWNMAVPGYGFDQAVISYLKNSESIPADGAILYVSKAVLYRMNFSVMFNKPKPRFSLDSSGRATLLSPAMGSTAMTDRAYRLLSPFYLPYFVEAQIARLLGTDLTRALAVRSTTPVDSATMSLAKAVLVLASERARTRGHELFLIAALPEESSGDLERFARARGITFISTGWTVPPSNLVFGPTDQHWIPQLHNDLGRRFAPILSQPR